MCSTRGRGNKKRMLRVRTLELEQHISETILFYVLHVLICVFLQTSRASCSHPFLVSLLHSALISSLFHILIQLQHACPPLHFSTAVLWLMGSEHFNFVCVKTTKITNGHNKIQLCRHAFKAVHVSMSATGAGECNDSEVCVMRATGQCCTCNSS